MAKSKRSKVADVTWQVRHRVIERDGSECVLCHRWCGEGTPRNIAHLIPRSNGGKGIEENLGLLCTQCHIEMDNGTHRKELEQRFRRYLEDQYPGFTDEQRKYKKEDYK